MAMKKTPPWLALAGCALLAGAAFWAQRLAAPDAGPPLARAPAEKGRPAGRPQAAASSPADARHAPSPPSPMPGGPSGWPAPPDGLPAAADEGPAQGTGEFIDADAPAPPPAAGGAAVPGDTGPSVSADPPSP